MHLPLNGPRFVVSQLSPWSIAVLPHFGFSVHEEVSSWQFVHFNVPPLKEELKSVHVFIWPNTFPSQLSPMFSMLLPHAPTIPWQFDVLILQSPLHAIFPPVNVEGL